MNDSSIILIRYGEIGLKGKNRRIFEKKLVSNIRKSLLRFQQIEVLDRIGRIFVICEPNDEERVIEVLQKVPGIFSLSPALKSLKAIEEIQQNALLLVQQYISLHGRMPTFKVETRRADKNYPYTSPEISKMVGGYIHSHVKNIQVDVHRPELLVTVEIRENAYLFCDRLPGLGGMPYGSMGKAMVLLSGGIDSPVAAYMMMRRGVEVEAIHYHSYPYTTERAQEKVFRLAKILSTYSGKVRLCSINILPIQKAIRKICPPEEITILSRCFMMMIATRIAHERKALGLVTGESVGQVASQTMQGIHVTSAMTDLPVYRPLISRDKIEIMEVARAIETFETSILPYEDCCTVFLPDRVLTKPQLAKIQHSLAMLPVEVLIDEALESAEVHVLRAKNI